MADRTLMSCVRARFPARFPQLVWIPTIGLDSLVSPLRLRSILGVCVFRCNLPPALVAEWPGSLTCHCGNTGVERTPNKGQHTKLTLEKKIFPPPLPGFELATFRSRVRFSNQQAIPTLSGCNDRPMSSLRCHWCVHFWSIGGLHMRSSLLVSAFCAMFNLRRTSL